MNKEIWKNIDGIDGVYQISNFGRVKSLSRVKVENRRELILKNGNNGKYLYVHFYKNKKQTNFSIHRLVAMAFVPNPKKLKEVNHKDGNKLNNNFENLEWCDRKDNEKHASLNGLKSHGEKHYDSKLKEVDILFIIKSYNNGIPQIKLSKKYGVTQQAISKIVNKLSWKHL